MRRAIVGMIAAYAVGLGAMLVAITLPPTALPPVAIAPTAWSTAGAPPTTGPSVRVGVIGGMVEIGFWDALRVRYLAETGTSIELIVAGPKDRLERAMTRPDAGIDLLTMHASDTIVNLVADGYALDPQPWPRNDMVIVGPPGDPAGVRGMTDAAAALRKSRRRDRRSSSSRASAHAKCCGTCSSAKRSRSTKRPSRNSSATTAGLC